MFFKIYKKTSAAVHERLRGFRWTIGPIVSETSPLSPAVCYCNNTCQNNSFLAQRRLILDLGPSGIVLQTFILDILICVLFMVTFHNVFTSFPGSCGFWTLALTSAQCVGPGASWRKDVMPSWRRSLPPASCGTTAAVTQRRRLVPENTFVVFPYSVSVVHYES